MEAVKRYLVGLGLVILTGCTLVLLAAMVDLFVPIRQLLVRVG